MFRFLNLEPRTLCFGFSERFAFLSQLIEGCLPCTRQGHRSREMEDEADAGILSDQRMANFDAAVPRTPHSTRYGEGTPESHGSRKVFAIIGELRSDLGDLPGSPFPSGSARESLGLFCNSGSSEGGLDNHLSPLNIDHAVKNKKRRVSPNPPCFLIW
jgi:hypothetical protein